MPTGHYIEDEFDTFDKIAKAERDALFFFYGVILALGYAASIWVHFWLMASNG